MRFKEILKEQLSSFLTSEELVLLPRGFQTVGKIVILKLNPQLLDKRQIIGNACLEILPNIRSIYLNLGKIMGKLREPEMIEFLAGEKNPIVEHREHDVIYQFDITKIMFSKGNLNERKFLATLVKPNEIIVDMFAGIGYFSLPIARHSKARKIYSIELNPVAYKFLVENVKTNKFQDKISPIQGDCRKEVLKLIKSGVRADRIIMGVFPAPKEYIKDALALVKPQGTVIHYEGVIDKQNYMDLFNEFQAIAKNNGYESNIKSKRFVKSYGPNLFHVVLDIFVIEKK